MNHTQTDHLALPISSAQNWRDFVEQHWERAPCFTDAPFSDLGVSADDLFEIVTHLPPRSPSSPNVRFYRGNAEVNSDVQRYLPTPDDGDWRGYADRLETDLQLDSYTLVINELQATRTTLWSRARDFLSGLYEQVGGLPSRYAELDVFFGRYPSTPFGIHQDNAGNFMFSLMGEKRVLLWPGERSGLPAGTHRYENASADAQHVLATPGSLTYWPSDAWHVLESPDEPTLALHAALHFSQDPYQQVYDAARAVLDDGSLGNVLPPFVPGSASAWTTDAAKRVTDALISPEGRRELVEHDMRRTTGFGFLTLPPTEQTAQLAPDARVSGGGFPILASELVPGVLSCSANGYMVRLPDSLAIRRVLAMLDDGQPRPVHELVGLASSDKEASRVTHLLSVLQSWRALDVAS